MKTLNRKTVVTIRQEMDAALRLVAQRHGMTFVAKGVTYSPSEGTISYRAGVVAQEIRKAIHPAIGKSFTFKGKDYEIVDYVARRHKYPVSAKRVRDGKIFKFTKQWMDVAR